MSKARKRVSTGSGNERGARSPDRPIHYSAIQAVGKVARLLVVQPLQFSVRHMTAAAQKRLAALDHDERIEFRGELVPQTNESELIASVEFEYVRARPGEIAIEVEGALMVGYEIASPPTPRFDPDTLCQFAEVNGVYNAWPFLRELISSCATRIGVPNVILPLWHPPAALPPRGTRVQITHARGSAEQ